MAALPRTHFLTALCFALLGGAARAKNPEQPETAAAPGTTFLDHSGEGPLWLGGEANSIFQYKPSFDAPYSGPHSLQPRSEAAISGLLTVFSAWSPFRTTSLIFDVEAALGGGISQTLGLAGFTNLDVVRNPTLSQAPYIARAQILQVVPLSSDWVTNQNRDSITPLPRMARHHLELRAGKLSAADLFDINPAGSDSHLQFMNWTVDNNGAWDFAADTRGYTYGLVIEYEGPRVEARFGELLMPTVANGIDLEWDLTTSHAENVEVELKYSQKEGRAGTVRLLGYENHANMGSYREANEAFTSGRETHPDIVAHRRQGRTKYGFGLGAIQELGPLVRGFLRLGWNDGANESFAYTEVDDTFEIGGDVRGTPWRRPNDKIGLAFVTNGLSDDHREYLRLGGSGFLLGDGRLRYGRESILEHYYNLQVWRGAFVAEDVQLIVNPGYNQDRGPVWVLSLRGHLEF